MRWIWRVAIAVGMSVVPAIGAWRVMFPFASPLAATIFVGGLAALPSCAIYGYLTVRYGPDAIHDNELRCRKCSYILRGLTEPRCPECGERI